MTEEKTSNSQRLPLAISRALRQAQAHPSVIRVEVTGRTENWIHAELRIRTELPAAWKQAGESPFGVRAFENVTVRFHGDFPLVQPLILLRNDFPRHHPHILPDGPEKPVRPCLVMGSVREIVQARGFLGLVEQLVEWLERAAELELNDPRKGWEPVRRDGIDDVAAFDAVRARALATSEGGAAYALSWYFHFVESDTYRLFVSSTTFIVGSNTGSVLTRSDGDGMSSGIALAILAWPACIQGESVLTWLYLPETVSNTGELLARASIYGCRNELESAMLLLRDELSANPSSSIFPLTIILLARRPYNLVGEDSRIEICPYLIEVAPGINFLEPSTIVRLAAHREIINPAILRRTSGDPPNAETVSWTMIGCGSVGSKIALHAARAGRAPSILIDRGTLDAHNFARHSTIPAEVDRLFATGKAKAVSDQITKLGQIAVSLDSDAITLLRTLEGRARLVPSNCAMIVDTTASLVTREAISHAPWPDRPRGVEACLLGAGELGYLAVEGICSNPSLSDLAAEAYRILVGDPLTASLVFGAEAEAVVIGQGCSAATFTMPDSQLSLFSASLAGPITRWIRDGLPERAMIRIGKLDGDYGLSWEVYEEEPWIVVPPASANSAGVRLHPRVHRAIVEDVANHVDVETGGVLVGRFSSIGNVFQIVDLIPAPSDSIRSAEEFVLGTRGLRRKAMDIAKRSSSALQVVGTWHSHLHPSGPSSTDAIAGIVLALRQFVPALLLIHTPVGYSALVAEAVLGLGALDTTDYAVGLK